jgi:hypothetical protein
MDHIASRCLSHQRQPGNTPIQASQRRRSGSSGQAPGAKATRLPSKHRYAVQQISLAEEFLSRPFSNANTACGTILSRSPRERNTLILSSAKIIAKRERRAGHELLRLCQPGASATPRQEWRAHRSVKVARRQCECESRFPQPERPRRVDSLSASGQRAVR